MYKLIVFDAYGTLFNTDSVKDRVKEIAGEKAEDVTALWRQTQLSHAFLRQIMGRYLSFDDVTKDALEYAFEKYNVPFNRQAINQTFEAYLHLKSFKEVTGALSQLKEMKKELSVFSNGNMEMLDPLIDNAGLSNLLDSIVSSDNIKQYKPAPSSYALILRYHAIKREDILFVSSNTWDITGASNFGFDTAWVNRDNRVFDKNGMLPNITVKNLDELVHWLKLN